MNIRNTIAQQLVSDFLVGFVNGSCRGKCALPATFSAPLRIDMKFANGKLLIKARMAIIIAVQSIELIAIYL